MFEKMNETGKPIDRFVLICYTAVERIGLYIPFYKCIRSDMLENFFKLRSEKQAHIVNAALTAFGSNGYKKASIADIAEQAGISKSMVMYYFGSKKNLYLYLVEFSGKIIVGEMEKHLNKDVTDFFDRLKMLTDMKIAVLKEHPSMLSFFTNMFYETDPEVAGAITELLDGSEDIRGKWIFEGIDISKFKEGVDPKLLEKFIIWAGVGCINDMQKSTSLDELDRLVCEFYKCFDMMKTHFYKEE